jgi:hypothetical protein
MKHLTLSFLLLSSINLSAGGVKFKKAVKAGHKKVAEASTKLAKTCGSKPVVISMHEMAKDLKVDGRTKDNVVSISASICASYVDNLTTLCKKDADYKEAIVVFKKITCIPNLEVKKEKGKSTYVSKGSILTITHHPTTTGSSGAYTKLKNSL